MPVTPIPTGPTNKELIDLAYLGISISDAMFGRTPEEYASAGLLLRAMMNEWPFDQLDFIDEDGAGLRIEERSGIDRKYSQGVALCLAERIAPAIGKTMTREAVNRKARSYSLICGAVADVPNREYADGTPRGAGQMRRFDRRVYFPEGG